MAAFFRFVTFLVSLILGGALFGTTAAAFAVGTRVIGVKIARAYGLWPEEGETTVNFNLGEPLRGDVWES